jgi:hypothetical protein
MNFSSVICTPKLECAVVLVLLQVFTAAMCFAAFVLAINGVFKKDKNFKNKAD